MKKIDLGLFLLRLSVGGLMLFHGISKLLGGIALIQGLLASKGLPGFIAYGTIIGEVLAPLAILIGFRTRMASAIYVFNCLVAIILVDIGQFFTMTNEGGWALELIALYLFGALALLFTGAGKIAVSTKSSWD